MNVVSNESAPFLIGLDVLREYQLVIDYHYNRVYSHILKRHLPCAILPTGHLALGMMPSNSEQRQHPVTSQALSSRPGAYMQGSWHSHIASSLLTCDTKSEIETVVPNVRCTTC